MRKNWLIVVLATVLTLIAAFALVGMASAAGSSARPKEFTRGRSSGNDGARCYGYTFGSHEGGPAYANAHPQAGREA